MSFHSLSFMGAGPVGALLCGYLVELFGPQRALILASLCMLAIVTIIGVTSRLWRLEGHVHQDLQEAADPATGASRVV
jgi:MFS-type transporter involved in bile tolerance (Atg22 family)